MKLRTKKKNMRERENASTYFAKYTKSSASEILRYCFPSLSTKIFEINNTNNKKTNTLHEQKEKNKKKKIDTINVYDRRRDTNFSLSWHQQ